MNPDYFGDSYDLVKRFFVHELTQLGYSVEVDGMFTGEWSRDKRLRFHHLIGAESLRQDRSGSARTALFLDPDTGINERGSKKHATFKQLAQKAARYELVFAFDQSFSRQFKAETVIRKKLGALKSHGCHSMYYDSHARFVFVAKERSPLDELQIRLISLGLPKRRLVMPDV